LSRPAKAKPRVGLVCDRGSHDGLPIHRAGDAYIAAIRDGAGALPLLIPALDAPLAAEDLLDAFDGFVFTGAASNVDPAAYGGAAPRDPALLDRARDAASLPLIRAAIAAGKPVLAICRGFQELNVALGGTLYQHVHELPGRLDHREDQTASLEKQFGPAHAVAITPGNLVASITGLESAMVNSLHHQGVDRLAPQLQADASAPDGQIEAVSMPCASGFVLGLQWHPEWRWAENPVSGAIFAAFGKVVAGT
jgi:putative glutamine amidotransferase